MTEYSLAQDRGFQLGSGRSNSKPAFLSLFDMLKAYAIGFYKVAIGLEEMRAYAGLASGQTKISLSKQGQFEKLLASIKEECKRLELNHTLNMTLGIESKYRRKIEYSVVHRFTGAAEYVSVPNLGL